MAGDPQEFFLNRILYLMRMVQKLAVNIYFIKKIKIYFFYFFIYINIYLKKNVINIYLIISFFFNN